MDWLGASSGLAMSVQSAGRSVKAGMLWELAMSGGYLGILIGTDFKNKHYSIICKLKGERTLDSIC